MKENLALIKIGRANLNTLSFADLEKIKLGERVFLSGVVFKDKIASLAINEGIVRSFNENLIETNIFEKNTFNGIPLFNIKGEILGISAIGVDGRVLTIPVSKIKIFQKDLKYMRRLRLSQDYIVNSYENCLFKYL